MTRQYVDIGYLDQDHLEQDYGSGTRLSSGGLQFKVDINAETQRGLQFEGQINAETQRGLQFESHIIDRPDASAAQFHGEIKDRPSIRAAQFQAVVDDLENRGVQFLGDLLKQASHGVQFEVATQNFPSSRGLQFLADINRGTPAAIEFLKNHYQTYHIEGYLEGGYGEDPYLTGFVGPRLPMQFRADMSFPSKRAFQFQVHIADFPTSSGLQFQPVIADQHNFGMQFKVTPTQTRSLAAQFEGHIIDKLNMYGIQFLANLQKEHGIGVQFMPVTQRGFGVQFLSTIYNTKYLRILHNFKSRGLSNTNWSSSTTHAGDFSPNNLDTDIIEQVWRSDYGVKSSIRLTCDVGAGQICYMDTLAILNHNMSVGANIVMLMSNDPTFVTGVEAITINPRRLNTYYIAPLLPTTGFRYFRLQIDDPTNSNDYIEIGTILFGAADIIQGENFTDEVDFEMVDYSDTINTEGFTNVSNSRALKRKLTLNFESINYEKRNYQILRNIYQTYRTTHKCLWIPTPSIVNQDITDRLAIFGKLTTVPKERHNNKGPGSDYVTFTIDLDESL